MARTRRRTGAATLTQLAELAVAAPQVVAVRTARMLAAGANPGAADRAEVSRMCTEKVQAFWESIFGMAMQAGRAQQEYTHDAVLRWMRLWTTTPSSMVSAAVKPVHKRAAANARRLGKVRKR